MPVGGWCWGSDAEPRLSTSALNSDAIVSRYHVTASSIGRGERNRELQGSNHRTTGHSCLDNQTCGLWDIDESIWKDCGLARQEFATANLCRRWIARPMRVICAAVSTHEQIQKGNRCNCWPRENRRGALTWLNPGAIDPDGLFSSLRSYSTKRNGGANSVMGTLNPCG